jgi:hypothetical protein
VPPKERTRRQAEVMLRAVGTLASGNGSVPEGPAQPSGYLRQSRERMHHPTYARGGFAIETEADLLRAQAPGWRRYTGLSLSEIHTLAAGCGRSSTDSTGALKP